MTIQRLETIIVYLKFYISFNFYCPLAYKSLESSTNIILFCHARDDAEGQYQKIEDEKKQVEKGRARAKEKDKVTKIETVKKEKAKSHF